MSAHNEQRTTTPSTVRPLIGTRQRERVPVSKPRSHHSSVHNQPWVWYTHTPPNTEQLLEAIWPVSHPDPTGQPDLLREMPIQPSSFLIKTGFVCGSDRMLIGINRRCREMMAIYIKSQSEIASSYWTGFLSNAHIASYHRIRSKNNKWIKIKAGGVFLKWGNVQVLTLICMHGHETQPELVFLNLEKKKEKTIIDLLRAVFRCCLAGVIMRAASVPSASLFIISIAARLSLFLTILIYTIPTVLWRKISNNSKHHHPWLRGARPYPPARSQQKFG